MAGGGVLRCLLPRLKTWVQMSELMVEGGTSSGKMTFDLYHLHVHAMACVHFLPTQRYEHPLSSSSKTGKKRKEAKKGMNWLKTNKIKDPWGRKQCQIPNQSSHGVLPKYYRISEFASTPRVCSVSLAWNHCCQSSFRR